MKQHFVQIFYESAFVSNEEVMAHEKRQYL